MSQNPQIEVPYPPPNGGQQSLGTLVAFCLPIRYINQPSPTPFKNTVTIRIMFLRKQADFDFMPDEYRRDI